MILMLMVLLSAAMRSQAPAVGAGIGLWIALLVFTGFPLIRDHSPAGLMAANDAALRGRDVALLWPLATTAIAGAAFLAGRGLVLRAARAVASAWRRTRRSPVRARRATRSPSARPARRSA